MQLSFPPEFQALLYVLYLKVYQTNCGSTAHLIPENSLPLPRAVRILIINEDFLIIIIQLL